MGFLAAALPAISAALPGLGAAAGAAGAASAGSGLLSALGGAAPAAAGAAQTAAAAAPKLGGLAGIFHSPLMSDVGHALTAANQPQQQAQMPQLPQQAPPRTFAELLPQLLGQVGANYLGRMSQ
jgi:hypothetical protein